MSRTDIAKLVPGAHEADAGHYSTALRHPPRRTPEAQADIAAARAAPVDADRPIGGPLSSEPVDLDTALSNAALADTPAVREMGSALKHIHDTAEPKPGHGKPLDVASLRNWLGCWGDGPNWSDDTGQTVPISKMTLRALLDEVDRLNGSDAVILTGTEAERYRAITAAARKAQASAATARADGAALLQLLQAFCAGLAPAGQTDADLARGTRPRPANLDKEP